MAKSKSVSIQSKSMMLSTMTAGGGEVRLEQHGKSPWLRNFIVMALAFSINHGCVTSVLGLASAEFGNDLSSIQAAVLYAMYTLSSLFLAVPMVKIFSPKKVLVFGNVAYCFYVIPFAVVMLGGDSLSKDFQIALVAGGAFIGGTGAGWLWTAQGAYFAKAAQLYSTQTGKPQEDVNGLFSGIFATIYVGFEVLLKLFSSLVEHTWEDGGKKFEFVFYAALAILAAMAMPFIMAAPKEIDEADKDKNCFSLMTGKLKDIVVVSKDIKIWLLSPINIGFGFCAAFLGQYINGKIGKESLGTQNIGLLTAIIPAYATIAGVPYAYIQKYVGKRVMMVSGCTSFLAIGLIGLLMSEEQLIAGGWGILILLYLIQGNVRVTYESTNKAVFADFFPNTTSGAFAMNAAQSGFSSTIGFLVWTPAVNISAHTAAIVLTAIGAAALIFVPLAFVVNEREKRGTMKEEALLSEYTLDKDFKQYSVVA